VGYWSTAVVLAVRLGVSTGFTKRARSVLLRGGAGEAVDTTILFEEVFLLAIRLKAFLSGCFLSILPDPV
jgi:hypothetical protein